MPNACHNGRDTQRVPQENSNTKDPPHSRRREDFYKALDQIAADLQAAQQELQARYELESQYAKHFLSCSRNEEYYALLDECQHTHLTLQWTSPNATYPFLDILTSMLVRRTELAHVEESAYENEPKLPCLSPHLSPRAKACSFESIRPKAMCSVPIAQKALRIDPSLIDNEKASLNRTMSLVGDENTYRDTLSSPRAAHASGQDLRTLSPMTRTVLKWSNEDSPGNAIRIPPNVIKDNASAHGAHSPLKCSLMARIRPDMICLPNEGRQPSMAVELSGTHVFIPK
jgi:hypothetical protein